MKLEICVLSMKLVLRSNKNISSAENDFLLLEKETKEEEK